MFDFVNIVVNVESLSSVHNRLTRSLGPLQIIICDPSPSSCIDQRLVRHHRCLV